MNIHKVQKWFMNNINIHKVQKWCMNNNIQNNLNIHKVQKLYRGSNIRLKRLPLILYIIQKHLQQCDFKFSNENNDGRINSCSDEDKIIDILSKRFPNKIKIPKIRMWYDILIYDNYYGWFPVNIKTTTTLTSDNTGNLAMCVYAYTDEQLNLHNERTYENGAMSRILIEKLKNKEYNRQHKKDYYFIVLNKNNNKDIIINSVKGLSLLTPNSNNLPFQICWNKNRVFKYDRIEKKVRMFIECLKKPNPSWKETFMKDIRNL
jgi:hypothetical protein